MLTAAALGMAGYGTFEVIIALTNIVNGTPLEWWAIAVMALLGTVLVMAAAFVRVKLPGGVALALGALLGLQALSLHNAFHEFGRVVVPLEIMRGALAAALIALAYTGSRRA